MQPCHSFALREVAHDEAGRPQSELLTDGTPTALRVPGVVLEAQYSCGDSYLLFTSENSPYEEALHILLLDRTFRPLDEVELSHSFAGGALADLQSAGDTQLRFTFFGGDLWELTVLNVPRRPSAREAPIGVKGRLRRRLSRRHLLLARLQ